ncbi:hypothetical protein [Paeniglutamicibacter sp. NPDC091659]|uniref:hypothetical protein n=1 Tax=Paeniglutamicibacter sp. NPDC091659 TaxID=3364389 RepID=UPI0037FAEBAF
MAGKNTAGSSTPEGRRNHVAASDVERFGGIKWGLAFFGWLTATGMKVLLGALATAIGVGPANTTDAGEAADQATQGAQTFGAIVLAVILLLAYFCGGYVAGRMARFDGIKQGVAVWLWGIIVAIIVALLAAFAGSRFDSLGRLGGALQLPADGTVLTIGGLVGLAITILVPLTGAVLGGKAGMHFHRKIDRSDGNHRAGFTG